MKSTLILILILTYMFAGAQTPNEKKAIKEMSEWLESPMELNEKPKSISIRDSRQLFWPSNQVEEAYLIDFTDSKGSKYIGFTGPITWAFFGIDFTKLNNEELYNLYTGWFICFYAYQKQAKEDPEIELAKKPMTDKLKKSGYKNIAIKTVTQMADDIFFEISASKNDQTKAIIGTINEFTEYDQSVILPLYKYVGEMWNPLETNE